MSEEERFACPSCGTLVSKSDRFCKNCGVSLTEFFEAKPEIPPPERAPEEVYERRLSLAKRFFKLLTRPSEAMRDIALAPDYGGVFVVVVVEFVLFSIVMVMALQKVQFSGPYAEEVSGILMSVMMLATILAGVLFIFRWLIKSLIVRYACDSGSGWGFRAAASLTGYAYVADIVVGVLGACVLWFFIPTFHFDLTDLDAAQQAVETFRAEVYWVQLLYSLPLSLFGLLWKSYLGGLGTHFGTKGKCSLRMGMAVFFVLGLIGLLISFAIQL